MTTITQPVEAGVAAQLRALLIAGELDLPQPGGGATARRWRHLAGWGQHDLALARLAEGHTDAVAILAEGGRRPLPGALYGVWASRSGRVGAQLRRDGGRLRLDGTVRFCSGAHIVDRALITASLDDDRVLIDVAVAPPAACPVPDTWQTAAMADADTFDISFSGLPVDQGDVIGAPGWYTDRPGFVLGGGGVAAVWCGGGSGLLTRTATHLVDPDEHQLAHFGELHALIGAAQAMLFATADAVDAQPAADHRSRIADLRGCVEHVVGDIVERVPKILGPAPLSRDGDLARTLADLALYIRQHHGARDHAAAGRAALDAMRLRR